MRALLSAVVVLSLGCGVGAVPVVEGGLPPCGVSLPSAKERLEEMPVTFLFQPGASFGSFTARRPLLEEAPVGLPLVVQDGRLELQAGLDAWGERLTVTRYQARLADVQFPAELLPPRGLVVTNLRFNLSNPAALRVHWLGDGAVGTGSGTVAIDLHAALRLSDGTTSPLDVGHLVAVPIDVLVERSGDGILLLSATARLDGPLWSWGGLFELGNVTFAVEANEAGALIELPETATYVPMR
jgi:hypothetical protein